MMTTIEYKKIFPKYQDYQKLIIKMMYLNDPYTAIHNDECALIARRIAQHMELDEQSVEIITLAASLHDVGKQGVPKVILGKPTKLSRAEYELVKTHVDIGVELLQSCNFPESILRPIREHHERIDGSGYPLGISGSDISFEGQIISVADVISSMQSKRTYRPDLSNDDIKTILLNEKSKFDNDLFTIALKVVDENILKH